jgi:hypothetical protein
MSAAQVRRGARFARISEDQAGDEHGVKNQLTTQLEHAERRGIVIADEHTYVDNDITPALFAIPSLSILQHDLKGKSSRASKVTKSLMLVVFSVSTLSLLLLLLACVRFASGVK